MTFDQIPETVVVAAAQAADAHLSALVAADEALDDGADPANVTYPTTLDVWDGCTSCQLREALHAGLPAALTEVIRLLRATGHGAAATDLETGAL